MMRKILLFTNCLFFAAILHGQISPVPASFSCDGIILSESFESGIPADWVNVNLDQVKQGSINTGWVIDTDTTFTAGTGPNGAQDGSFYVYCDGSGPIGRGDTASMFSPIITIGDVNEPALTFYLNMHGQAGSFTVNVISEGLRTGVLPDISADQIGGIHTADEWEQVYVDLSAYVNQTIQIEFVTIKPDGDVSSPGDISIDNVVVCSAATSIPTMGEWSLIILSLMMMIVGLQYMRATHASYQEHVA